ALRLAFFSKLEFFSVAGLDRVGIDWRVLLFTLASAAGATLFFGIAPAAASARADLNDALRSGGRGATSSDRGRFRSTLIVVEVALSLILLTGAGLLAKSFAALLSVNPGFQPERLLAAGLTLPRTQYRSTEQAAEFYDTLLERARALPGVRSAAITDTVPLTGDDNRFGIKIDGRTAGPDERWRMHPRLVSSGYLETMGIALLQGRTFSVSDAAGNIPVAIVSENAARRYWPDGRALGRRFAFDAEHAPWIEVIGIAAPVHNRALDEESTPDVYVPLRGNPFGYPPTEVALMLRTGDSPTSLGSALRATVSSLDRTLAISRIQSMEAYVADSVAPKKFNLVLLGIFAVLAVALAAAGLYGVMTYLVSRRSGEIGIRMALGARQGDVLRLVIGNGLALAGIGVAIGLAASFVATRFMTSLLFGVRPFDPLVFAAVPALLIAVGALASFVPARRASRVDPLEALRIE
ncbi:MAG: ABC transporter permease, partial [Acidobacteriia bacterium]|nr:ABC transporter permease [Terriglobia bacterium]